MDTFILVVRAHVMRPNIPIDVIENRHNFFYPALIIQLHHQVNDPLFPLELHTSLFLIDKNHICEVDLPAEKKKRMKK